MNEQRSSLAINFHPNGEVASFQKAASEYEGIWRADGARIVSTLEGLSGLQFNLRLLYATVYDGMSWSDPLRLNHALPPQIKKGALVHELTHILIKRNKPTYEFSKDVDQSIADSHKLVDLVLYDAWVDLYGEELARENVAFENELLKEHGSPYQKAWDWALGMTREQRQAEFRKYFESR